jgi:hypothetical protein
MKNLMQEMGKTVKRVWNIKIWRVVFALVLIAGLASVAYFPGRQALADSKSNSADVIFTKWVTTAPGYSLIPGNDIDVIFNMEGVDSGDTGPGLFAGEVLLYNETVPITTIHALYHINGSTHSFTADVHVTQDNLNGSAVITGVVTQSTGNWMLGAEVTGSYQVIWPSGIENAIAGAAGNVAFQGTLHLKGH